MLIPMLVCMPIWRDVVAELAVDRERLLAEGHRTGELVQEVVGVAEALQKHRLTDLVAGPPCALQAALEDRDPVVPGTPAVEVDVEGGRQLPGRIVLPGTSSQPDRLDQVRTLVVEPCGPLRLDVANSSGVDVGRLGDAHGQAGAERVAGVDRGGLVPVQQPVHRRRRLLGIVLGGGQLGGVRADQVVLLEAAAGLLLDEVHRGQPVEQLPHPPARAGRPAPRRPGRRCPGRGPGPAGGTTWPPPRPRPGRTTRAPPARPW